MRQRSGLLQRTCDDIAPDGENDPPLSALTREGLAIYEVEFAASGLPVDYIIREANPAWRQLLKIPESVNLNQRASTIFTATPPPYLEHFAAAIRTHRPYEFTSPYVAGARCFEIAAHPIAPNTLAVSFIEVTKWKTIEQQLHSSTKDFSESLRGIVTALSTTSAWRDPYTSSHQLHVAQIACAIAETYGLPREEIEGIYVAGLLHDIGKIAVPIEILCKPGKITEHEFGIIRSHPQVGYDILREIHFPWPIADIVLQHHAHLDGSGYPANYSEENILPAARILAVADVVEAMSSHRPYRPALGIAQALAEIEQHAGSYYDRRVVEACTQVFREQETSAPWQQHVNHINLSSLHL